MTRASHRTGPIADHECGVPETTCIQRLAGVLVGSRQGVGVTGVSGLRGLALRLAELEEGGEERFEIVGIDERGVGVITLGEFCEEDVVAIWRRLGAATGLMLMLQNPDGSLMEPYPQIGAVQLGTIHIRRRHGLLRHRRPRFLTRRKVGFQTARPLVFRENEIIAGSAVK